MVYRSWPCKNLKLCQAVSAMARLSRRKKRSNIKERESVSWLAECNTKWLQRMQSSECLVHITMQVAVLLYCQWPLVTDQWCQNLSRSTVNGQLINPGLLLWTCLIWEHQDLFCCWSVICSCPIHGICKSNVFVFELYNPLSLCDLQCMSV